jgi:hypothetical protein
VEVGRATGRWLLGIVVFGLLALSAGLVGPDMASVAMIAATAAAVAVVAVATLWFRVCENKVAAL